MGPEDFGVFPLGDCDHGVSAAVELLQVDGDVEIAEIVWDFINIVFEAIYIAVIRQLFRGDLDRVCRRLGKEGPAASKRIDVA